MKNQYRLQTFGNGAAEISYSGNGARAIEYNTKDYVGFVDDVVVLVKDINGYLWEDDDKEKVALVVKLMNGFGWI